MDLEKQFAELGIKLTEKLVTNTASIITNRVSAARAKSNDKETIQELEQIINDLLADKSDLLQIAQSYKQEFVAQQVSSKDIKYINDKFLPVIKDVIVKSAGSDEAKAKALKKTIDDFAPLLSIETLTVLQLLGFNYKQAIGEPLTLFLQKAITAKVPPDPMTNIEYAKLALAHDAELAKVAQDKEAFERYEKLRAK